MKVSSSVALIIVIFFICGVSVILLPGLAYSSGSELKIPLMWIGKSLENSVSVPSGSILGSKVQEGLSLPLIYTEGVFDNGEYTDDINKNSVPHGIDWVSWPQWHGISHETYEVRRIQATFMFPFHPDLFNEVILFSPFYSENGNIIPLNDNIYVYINNQFIGHKGTAYGALNSGIGEHGEIARETDGWFQDGSFGSEAVSALIHGVNTVDIICEELSGWGGLGRLELKLTLIDADLIKIHLDIFPGSHPNNLNTSSTGEFIVSISGTPELDIKDIDTASIRLLDVAPYQSTYEDTTTLLDPCGDVASDCALEGPDGVIDLNLTFDTREIVQAIAASLGRNMKNNEEISLPIIGKMNNYCDNAPFTGSDSVVVTVNE